MDRIDVRANPHRAVVSYVRSSRSHASRMMRVNRKVSDLAQLDALTSLVNRRAFVERLQSAFAACRRGAKPFAVHYFDLIIQGRQRYARTRHRRRVAAPGRRRVKSAVRENDVIARFGGDEFAVCRVMSRISRPQAHWRRRSENSSRTYVMKVTRFTSRPVSAYRAIAEVARLMP